MHKKSLPMDLNGIDIPTIEKCLSEINEAYFDIPFNNTSFQTEMFVIAQQVTPARAYRSIGLQISSVLAGLKELLIQQELDNIDIEELQEKLATEDISRFDVARTQIKIKNLMDCRESRKKRVSDSVHELNILYKHFCALPRYTREQFEQEERLYFEQSLQRQTLGITGAREAIVNMVEDYKNLINFQKEISLIPEQELMFKLEEIRNKCLDLRPMNHQVSALEDSTINKSP